MVLPSLGFQSGVLAAISQWDFHATQALMMLIRRQIIASNVLHITYNSKLSVLYRPADRVSCGVRQGDLSVESTLLHWHNLTILHSTIEKPYPFPSKPRHPAIPSDRCAIVLPDGRIYSSFRDQNSIKILTEALFLSAHRMRVGQQSLTLTRRLGNGAGSWFGAGRGGGYLDIYERVWYKVGIQYCSLRSIIWPVTRSPL